MNARDEYLRGLERRLNSDPRFLRELKEAQERSRAASTGDPNGH